MFSGPPLQLPPDLPLRTLFAQALPPGILGAWVRGSSCTLHLHEAAGGTTGRILVSPDLGFLLGRCSRIALREGERSIVLPTGAVIEWRTLQVITSSPYLPGLQRLHEIFPGADLHSSGFQVPISGRPPEHVLAECLTHGIPVKESRIIYRAGN